LSIFRHWCGCQPFSLVEATTAFGLVLLATRPWTELLLELKPWTELLLELGYRWTKIPAFLGSRESQVGVELKVGGVVVGGVYMGGM
jgi:hypothetical protein